MTRKKSKLLKAQIKLCKSVRFIVFNRVENKIFRRNPCKKVILNVNVKT
jgi:hypothetical protein